MTTRAGPEGHDVAVVGGGPAGAVSALVLARRGRDVVLLEATRYEGWRVGETLFPSLREPLAALGLGPVLDVVPAVDSNGVRSCWGGAEPRAQSFLASPEADGWHVDRTAFDRRCCAGAATAGATVHRGTRVAECVPDGDGGVTLQLAAGSGDDGDAPPAPSVSAAGLLDATGRRATIARRLGAERDVLDRLVAVAGRLTLPVEACGRYALVEAVPAGWWYSAPLPGDGAVAMLFTDGDLVDDRDGADAWWRALDATGPTADRLADATLEQGPTVAAAVSQRLERSLGTDRWLAVGDAAVAVDPLSGRGVERAVDTGVRGALAMDAWLDGDRDAAEAFRDDVAAIFADYRDERGTYYGLEERFADRPFWERRHKG